MKIAEDSLTGWISADARPVRVGVYQMYSTYPTIVPHPYRYWDGKHWYYGVSTDPHQAKKIYDACYKIARNQVQNPTKWRGLKVEPKSGK